MNILYYLGFFPRLSQSFVLNEIYELEQTGHNVAVCSVNHPGEPIVHEEYQKLEVPTYYIPKPSYSNLPTLFSPKILHPRILRHTLNRSSHLDKAANLFRTKKSIEYIDSLNWEPDHVHTHFATSTRYAAKHLANYYQIPFTITTHAHDIFQEPVGAYTGSLLRSADRIVTISKYNQNYIKERFAPNSPIDIIRAGIRPEKFKPTNTDKSNRIVTVARLIEKKGLPVALEALARVTERMPDVEYHIIGSGEQHDKLTNKTKRLGLDDTVTFLNNVTDERLIKEIDEARVFLLPSVIAESGDRDGIPVALMESMAMKTPPVSTTVSGIPELIDHEKNGLLTAPNNPDSTAEAVVRLLENDSEWNSYAEMARKKVESKFNITEEAKKLEATFQKASENF